MKIKGWDGKVNLDEDLVVTSQKVYEELSNVAVGRTPFQLVHFVVQSHGSIEEGAGPIMRLQALTEMENCINGIIMSKINLERLKRKDERLKSSNEQDSDLDIAENLLHIRTETLRLTKKLREYYVLQAILDELPEYTWEDFQNMEPKRWTNRLFRQCDEYHKAYIEGLDRGDIQAIKQGICRDVLDEVGNISEELVNERYSKLEAINTMLLAKGDGKEE